MSLAVGQTLTPTNFTSSTADLADDDKVNLLLSEQDNMVPLASVLGLTTKAKQDIPPTGLSGIVFLSTTANDQVPKPSNVAFISCDPYPGYLGATTLFGIAQQQDVKAIVFYSETADYCDLEGYFGTYSWVYSMKSVNATEEMLKRADTSNPATDGKVYATVGYENNIQMINGTSGDGSSSSSGSSKSGSNNSGGLGPASTTAVAMIILYSITGVITGLFLIIIITGAVRAHRHPERYGPRNIIGRSRQSRAKGLARAMLDTLPIVKFGDHEEPKPADVELADGTMVERDEGIGQQRPTDDALTGQPHEADPRRQSAEGGIAAATAAHDLSANPNRKGCSICTEDFEPGQDQRVLPCDHRFHPDCVDPWLLNVSGTCPLCRIDLRPAASGAPTGEVDENGDPILQEGEFQAPPLGPQETAGERQRLSIRRSIILGIMNVGRTDWTTREERVMALRELRGQQLARQRREQQASVAETPEEEGRTRRRLGNMLRRTPPRPTEPEHQSDSTDANPP